MGKGKGSPELWVAVVKPGRVMFEIEGVSKELAETAMGLAAAKLGVKTKFVAREAVTNEAEEIRGLADDELVTASRNSRRSDSASGSAAAPKRWKSRCGCAASAATSRLKTVQRERQLAARGR